MTTKSLLFLLVFLVVQPLQAADHHRQGAIGVLTATAGKYEALQNQMAGLLEQRPVKTAEFIRVWHRAHRFSIKSWAKTDEALAALHAGHDLDVVFAHLLQGDSDEGAIQNTAKLVMYLGELQNPGWQFLPDPDPASESPTITNQERKDLYELIAIAADIWLHQDWALNYLNEARKESGT